MSSAKKKPREEIDLFQSSDLGPLREAIEQAVKNVHPSLDIKVYDMIYDSFTATARCRIRLDVKDQPTDPNFEKFLEQYELDPEQVTQGYKLRGYDPTRKKKPVMVRRLEDGKTFATSIKLAKTMFKRLGD